MKLILIIAILFFNTLAYASDRCASSPDKLLNLLSMKYQEFDQTPGGGFRELYSNGCYLSAAILIDAWHLNNLNTLSPIESSASYFHAGQNYAYQGSKFYLIAIKHFQLALLIDEVSIQKYKFWNPFVNGTIAFFKKDKADLIKNLNVLKMLPNDNKEMTFIVALESLLKDFDKPYLGNDQPKPAN